MDPTKNYLDRQKTYLNESSNFTTTPIYKSLKLGVQLLDPTGVTSYGDVADAYSDFKNERSLKNGANLALEVAGALPVIGKLGKVAKGFNYMSKYAPSLFKMSKLVDKGIDFQKSLDNAKDIYNNGMKVVDKIPTGRKTRGNTDVYKKVFNKDTWFDPSLKGIDRLEVLQKRSEFKKASDYLNNYKLFNAGQIGVRSAANLDDSMDVFNILE